MAVMNMIATTTDLAGIIQLAVAPVFLLAGIAGFLNVMSGRLGRIIDRVRVVDARLSKLEDAEQVAISEKELKMLRRRSNIINKSIGLCTGSGLLVCMLVVSLFIGDYLVLPINGVIVGFFVLSMLLLILALLFFLREIQLATRTLNIAREF